MILRLIDWLLRRMGGRLDAVPAEVIALMPDALDLVKRWEPILNSGEYKRRQVYARLLKLHPEAHKQHIAWAIERAVRRR